MVVRWDVFEVLRERLDECARRDLAEILEVASENVPVFRAVLSPPRRDVEHARVIIEEPSERRAHVSQTCFTGV